MIVRKCSSRGFSLVEASMATMVFGVLAATTLQLMTAVKLRADRASTELDLEQQGRQASELLLDDIRLAGLGIHTNDDGTDASTRQHSVIEASPYRLAFYADAGPGIESPMETETRTWRDGSEWTKFPNVFALTFPSGVTTTSGREYYKHLADLRRQGQAPEYLLRPAEVVLYTLDANDDGVIDRVDKAAPGVRSSDNPSDGLLRRQAFGTGLNGRPYRRKSRIVVSRHVRVWTEDEDTYPNGDKPLPLFTYHLSETLSRFDFNDDGDSDDLLLFGDSDGNGTLGQLERGALLHLSASNGGEVGDDIAVDTRFQTVLARLSELHPEASQDDLRQMVRNSIAAVDVNLVLEMPGAKDGYAHPVWSVPGEPYPYVQHDLSATAYLPNAFFLSGNQLLASGYLPGDPEPGPSPYDPSPQGLPPLPDPCQAAGMPPPDRPGPGVGRARADFNGDGKSDLFWRHGGNGANSLWLIDGDAVVSMHSVTPMPPAGPALAVGADVDGNGTSDLLWRDAAIGTDLAWLMNGAAATEASLPVVLGQHLEIVGSGDVDGNGTDDLIWRDSRRGTSFLWLMENGGVTLSAVLPWVPDPGYEIAAVADLDGNGRDDLLWRHATQGWLYAWLMNATVPSQSVALPPLADADLDLAASGDVDADGDDDLVWRNSLGGNTYVWIMEDAAAVSASELPLVADTAFAVEGSGDFDGDGKADLLWHHAMTGASCLWFLDGPAVAFDAALPSPAIPGTAIVLPP
ncbi:MAG TPA: FG-GAP-like repeat-containing protein [Candidatus Limnocylindrales bacterium]|nr:FG-GAP-like repeat-containing protein [Candidatus Limnocylindrales bacterium]